MNPFLEKAIREDDLEAVIKLVETEKADWQEDDQQALYVAAECGNKDILGYFLKELLKPKVIERCRRILRAAGDDMSDDEIDFAAKDMVTGHFTTGSRLIDQAICSPGNRGILGHAVDLHATGLFRYLVEHDPETVLDVGPAFVSVYRACEFVRPLVEMGASAGFAQGDIFSMIVRSGDVATARLLLEKGIIPDSYSTVPGMSSHPLCFATAIFDKDVQREMIDLLLIHGADIRSGKCHSIGIMVSERKEQVFEFVEKADPGSQLPLLAGIHDAVKYNVKLPDFLGLQYPFAVEWFTDRLIHPVFNTNYDSDGSWAKKLKEIDADKDDGFLLKCAVMSPNADFMMPFVLGFGTSPNTQRDQPVKLAVMLEKPELLDTLVGFGADVYAADAAAFTEALRVQNPHLNVKLGLAALRQAEMSKKILASRYGENLTLPALKETKEGETGLVLAAKAGEFAALLGRGIIKNLCADDFTTAGATGANLLCVLASRGEYGAIFNKKVWGDDNDGPVAVWNRLSGHHKSHAEKIYNEFRQDFIVAENRKKMNKNSGRYKL